MSLPVALDTNVLVRLLVNDDPAQAEQAATLIDASAACFVPITVALELEWVLRGGYKLPREAVISVFEGLLAGHSPSPSGAGRAREASLGVAPAGHGLCRCAPLSSQRGLWRTDQF
jgi:hypothetical protein